MSPVMKTTLAVIADTHGRRSEISSSTDGSHHAAEPPVHPPVRNRGQTLAVQIIERVLTVSHCRTVEAYIDSKTNCTGFPLLWEGYHALSCLDIVTS